VLWGSVGFVMRYWGGDWIDLVELLSAFNLAQSPSSSLLTNLTISEISSDPSQLLGMPSLALFTHHTDAGAQQQALTHIIGTLKPRLRPQLKQYCVSWTSSDLLDPFTMRSILFDMCKMPTGLSFIHRAFAPVSPLCKSACGLDSADTLIQEVLAHCRDPALRPFDLARRVSSSFVQGLALGLEEYDEFENFRQRFRFAILRGYILSLSSEFTRHDFSQLLPRHDDTGGEAWSHATIDFSINGRQRTIHIGKLTEFAKKRPQAVLTFVRAGWRTSDRETPHLPSQAPSAAALTNRQRVEALKNVLTAFESSRPSTP